MMKKILLIIISLFYFSTYSQSFFDMNTIQKIELEFAQSNWDAILDSYHTAGLKTRLIGKAVINGVDYDSVGVRYKGNSSYHPDSLKNPFNIKLDYIKGSKEIEGRNVLKLSNVFKDPSYVREVVAYEIARKYMPSPESNFVEVYVNGTLIGLYVNDESTNLSFMGRHYFKPNYPYFEGELDPTPPQAPCPIGPPKVFGYLGTDTSCYKRNYTIQSNNPLDWFQLANAMDTFNNYPNYIEEAIYIDRLLWMLAYDNVMVNLDAPINPAHNFSLYKDKTDRFNPILWDLNECFGSFNLVVGAGGSTLTNTELKELSPWFHTTNVNYPIFTKTFAKERYKKMYIAKMKTIFNENIKNDLYKERATAMQTLVSSKVNTDPHPFYEHTEFTQNLNSTVQGIIGLTELMDGRKTYLNTQADFLKVAPIVSNITNSPQEVHSNDAVTISANISNATYAYLGYRFSPKEKFKIVDMSASGSTYSATINVNYADIQYYIWAENTDAGIFSPERAEYEFHRIGVTGDLVINELQSSNKQTQFDEQNEYDDWVELYNNSDAAIDISGYFLSDNKDTLTKWKFPTQSIAAHDYLIVWTDKDIAQGLNHTNFQLTKNGESLYLVDTDKNIIDQLTYTHMPTDMSFSRYINGRGAFEIRTPTHNATNGGDPTEIGINAISKDLYNVNLYPNPIGDILYLSSTNKNVLNKNIVVFDISGRILLENKWTTKTQKINVSDLNAGIYFIEIDKNTIKKFVKK